MISSLLKAVKAHFSFIPACCQNCACCVLSLFQVIRYLVGLEAEMLAVGCPARCKLIVSNLLSIQIEVVKSQCSYRYECLFYRLCNCELTSYVGSFGIVLVSLFLSGYKHCFPLFIVHDSCDKSCLCPVCFFPCCSYFYTGKIFLLGFQLYVLRLNLRRCIAVYFSALIDLFCKSCIFCDLQLTGLLDYISLVTF